jgi:hypothetical protein
MTPYVISPKQREGGLLRGKYFECNSVLSFLFAIIDAGDEPRPPVVVVFEFALRWPMTLIRIERAILLPALIGGYTV